LFLHDRFFEGWCPSWQEVYQEPILGLLRVSEDLVPERLQETLFSGEADRRHLTVGIQNLRGLVPHLLLVSDEYSRCLHLCRRLAYVSMNEWEVAYFAARRFASIYLASIMMRGVPVYLMWWVIAKPMWRRWTPCW
jgi:hypothetical protein